MQPPPVQPQGSAANWGEMSGMQPAPPPLQAMGGGPPMAQPQGGVLGGGGAFGANQFAGGGQQYNQTGPSSCECGGGQNGAQPHGYCCAPTPPGVQQQSNNPFESMCDVSTCSVFLFFILSLVGFIIVMVSKDDIFADVNATDERDSAFLTAKIHNDIPWRLQAYYKAQNETNVSAPDPTPVPETPVPETPVPETPVPETDPPPPKTPTLLATKTVTPSLPVPTTPTPETPVPETPTPDTPVPSSLNISHLGLSVDEEETLLKEYHSKLAKLRRLLLETENATEAIPTPAPVLPTIEPSKCGNPKTLHGIHGKVCMDDMLSAEVFLLNLSNWHKFRATLYFIAFFGTLVMTALIILIHRVRHDPQMHQDPEKVAMLQQQINFPQPWALFGTKLYEVFRVGWGAVSVVVFMWCVVEMDTYWRFIAFYKDNTTGDLHDFWVKYDKKYVATVVCAFIFVCWPLCEMALQVAFWFAGIFPWFLYRSMCLTGIGEVRHPEMDIEDLPGCVRVDMFFVDCEQIGRWGFSTRMWELLTGTRRKHLDCMDTCGQQQPMFNQHGQFNQQPQQLQQNPSFAPQPQTMGMSSSNLQRPDSATVTPSGPSTPRNQSSSFGPGSTFGQPPTVAGGTPQQQHAIPAPPTNQFAQGQGGVPPPGMSPQQIPRSQSISVNNNNEQSFVAGEQSQSGYYSETSPSKKSKKEKKDKKDKKEKKEKKRRKSEASIPDTAPEE